MASRKRDVTWAAITAPDADAPSDYRWLSGNLQCSTPAILQQSEDLQLAPAAARRSQQLTDRHGTAGDSSAASAWVVALGQN